MINREGSKIELVLEDAICEWESFKLNKKLNEQIKINKFKSSNYDNLENQTNLNNSNNFDFLYKEKSNLGLKQPSSSIFSPIYSPEPTQSAQLQFK